MQISSRSHRTARATAMLAASVGALFAATGASAGLVFNDDFESGMLDAWVGKSLGAHEALIVNDPTDPSNHAITFESLESAGEIFSAQFFSFADAPTYEVSFDYLGFEKIGSVAGNLGGFIGFSEGTPGTHTWMYGTSSVSGAAPDLIDDGAWRTYSFTVDSATAFGGDADGFRLMIEDFSGSGGVAGDAFFDNITVRAVPSPGATILAACGFLVSSRRRQSR